MMYNNSEYPVGITQHDGTEAEVSRRDFFLRFSAKTCSARPIWRGEYRFLRCSRAPEYSAHLLVAFRQGLAEGGFVEGQNVAIDFPWARGQYDLLPAMAIDLVGRRVNVLTTAGGEPSALAAKRATSTIPIVIGQRSDQRRLGRELEPARRPRHGCQPNVVRAGSQAA
jgi:hypothetical protein